jgi:phosphonopyruvate decarboxylase
MVHCFDFSAILRDNGIRFFSGVPDSLLKDICGFISERFTGDHIIAANEGNAVGIAAGYHLATGEIPLVYLQNSGLGNTINPITSLMSEDVYQIPMLLLIGWRGEPGVPDEPQHANQGKITKALLEVLNIPTLEIRDELWSRNADDAELRNSIGGLITTAREKSCPVALLVSKDAFESYPFTAPDDEASLSREHADTTLARALSTPETLIVSTTGKLSRELYEYRKREGSDVIDFYNVGSMGHLSQIALGLAKYAPNRNVFCFDGDGAALMHLGGLAIAAAEKRSNYFYVMFNNGAHDSVGGQPTVARQLDFEKIALGLGFEQYLKATNEEELEAASKRLRELDGPVFLEVLVKTGARSDLGRPVETPRENKIAFMNYVQRQT